MFRRNFESPVLGIKVALGGLVIFLSLAMAGDSAKSKKPEQARAQGSSGMVVSRSPETGGFASEPSADPAQPSLLSAQSLTESQQVVLPNGMVMVKSTEQHMSTSVVTREADGTLAYRCLEGTKGAEALVDKQTRSAGKPGGGKEGVHAVR